jgi:hypothetical protein
MDSSSVASCPRPLVRLEVSDSSPQMIRKLHDPNVSFEEYLHYARESRAWESSSANVALPGIKGPVAAIKRHMGHRDQQNEIIQGISVTAPEDRLATGNEKTSMTKGRSKEGSFTGPVEDVVTDDEWSTAARAARTATWGAVFFLLTTDILGPFSAPFVLPNSLWRNKSVLTCGFLDGRLLKLVMVLAGPYTLYSVCLLASKSSLPCILICIQLTTNSVLAGSFGPCLCTSILIDIH